MASNFTSLAVNHIPRSCNMVADSLAALGASLSMGADPVLDSIPSCILDWLSTIWQQVMGNGRPFHVSKKKSKNNQVNGQALKPKAGN
jgi:hypothetical protein